MQKRKPVACKSLPPPPCNPKIRGKLTRAWKAAVSLLDRYAWRGGAQDSLDAVQAQAVWQCQVRLSGHAKINSLRAVPRFHPRCLLSSGEQVWLWPASGSGQGPPLQKGNPHWRQGWVACDGLCVQQLQVSWPSKAALLRWAAAFFYVKKRTTSLATDPLLHRHAPRKARSQLDRRELGALCPIPCFWPVQDWSGMSLQLSAFTQQSPWQQQ